MITQPTRPVKLTRQVVFQEDEVPEFECSTLDHCWDPRTCSVLWCKCDKSAIFRICRDWSNILSEEYAEYHEILDSRLDPLDTKRVAIQQVSHARLMEDVYGQELRVVMYRACVKLPSEKANVQ